LRAAGRDVIVFSNSTNREIIDDRAETWDAVETLVRARYSAFDPSSDRRKPLPDLSGKAVAADG
jgi:hypothetical protein